MTNASRVVYRFWTAVVFLAVIVQVGAAGYGAFYAYHNSDKAKTLDHKQFDHGFGLHIGLGYLILIGSVLLVLFAVGGRLGRRLVMQAVGLPVLVLIAIVLAVAGESVPAIGVLHPIDALLIVGLSGSLAFQAWRERKPAP